MSTENTALAYRLDAVDETQTVVLRDVVGAPNVAKVYGVTDIVITTITIRYTRPGHGAWKIANIRIDGWRAKKDGTAGGQESDTSWWEPMSEGKYHTPAPRWLQEIALRYLPGNPRPVAHLPGEPDADSPPADVADLDALES